MTTVRTRREGRVFVIGLDRPQKLNAFDDALLRDLADAMAEADADDGVRAIVIHGEGRCFSTGADISPGALSRIARDGAPRSGPPPPRPDELLQNLSSWKPVVVAVHGYAFGMGFGLALEAEIVVASDDALFEVTEGKLGLGVARYSSLLRFRGAAGFGDEVCLTARRFGAQEALEHHIVNEVVPAGQHVARAIEIASEIAAHPPLGVRTVVRMRRYEIKQFSDVVAMFVEPQQLHLRRDPAPARPD